VLLDLRIPQGIGHISAPELGVSEPFHPLVVVAAVVAEVGPVAVVAGPVVGPVAASVAEVVVVVVPEALVVVAVGHPVQLVVGPLVVLRLVAVVQAVAVVGLVAVLVAGPAVDPVAGVDLNLTLTFVALEMPVVLALTMHVVLVLWFVQW
jgi:hypothetical protein